MHVPAKKISVVPHGVMLKPAKTGVQIREQLPTKPYLLFIGAGDMRRRVEDLVDAYNNLKAEGNDIQLALAGENFIAPEMIPNIRVREAVMKSSYKEDILCLGYISDEAKDQLYQRAIAFVYPTLYEGFGIPILEAMLRGCPVITYRNSSTMEVGTDHALYAQGWWGIKEQVEIILGQTSAQKQNLTIRSQAYARQFTWKRSAKTIFEILINITRS